MTTLLDNRKNMKNFIFQYKLFTIIKNLQNENNMLKQIIENLQNELEEVKDNVGAKKLVLYKN